MKNFDDIRSIRFRPTRKKGKGRGRISMQTTHFPVSRYVHFYTESFRTLMFGHWRLAIFLKHFIENLWCTCSIVRVECSWLNFSSNAARLLKFCFAKFWFAGFISASESCVQKHPSPHRMLTLSFKCFWRVVQRHPSMTHLENCTPTAALICGGPTADCGSHHWAAFSPTSNVFQKKWGACILQNYDKMVKVFSFLNFKFLILSYSSIICCTRIWYVGGLFLSRLYGVWSVLVYSLNFTIFCNQYCAGLLVWIFV